MLLQKNETTAQELPHAGGQEMLLINVGERKNDGTTGFGGSRPP